MPHCIVEYSQNLEQEVSPVDWMDAMKKACVDSELFSPDDIKVRSRPYKNFITAGQEDAFVHVTLRLLSGRTQTQKQHVSKLLLEALLSFSVKNVSYSVELCDMDRETYNKQVVLS
ncbi:5-carboxymethyl-2-hydroxymuconate Delta-isomerase [Marinomonas epiphytica]